MIQQFNMLKLFSKRSIRFYSTKCKPAIFRNAIYVNSKFDNLKLLKTLDDDTSEKRKTVAIGNHNEIRPNFVGETYGIAHYGSTLAYGNGIAFVDLIDVQVNFTQFENIDFSELACNNTKFNNCIFDDTTFGSCTFKNIKFVNKHMTKTRFYNCIFENVLFDSLILDSCTFHDCEIDNVKFDNATIINSHIVISRINNLNFDNIQKTELRIRSSDLRNVKFDSFKQNCYKFGQMDLVGRHMFSGVIKIE